MNHDLYYILGFCVAIAVCVPLALILKKLAASNGKPRYDERQLRVQAKAHEAGYISMMCFLALYAFTDSLHPWCELSFGMFLCICLSVTIFACICISGDAYFALNSKPKLLALGLGLLGIGNIFIGIRNILEEDVLEDGLISFRCSNIVVGVMLVIVVIASIIHNFVFASAASDSDDEQ